MRKDVLWRVWFAIGIVICLPFAMVACSEDLPAESYDTEQTEIVTETSSEETPATDTTDEETEETASGEETNADNIDENAADEGDANADEDSSDDTNENGDSSYEGYSSYLEYLYETNRLAYYQYAAESGLFDLFSLDMFDLTNEDTEGRYAYVSVDMAGDYSLVTYGAESAARIRIAVNGAARIYGSFGEVTVTLRGTYNKDFDIITESGETFALSEDMTKTAHLLYYLPIGDAVYPITIDRELGAVRIDEGKDALLARLSACVETEVPNDEEENGTDGSGGSGDDNENEGVGGSTDTEEETGSGNESDGNDESVGNKTETGNVPTGGDEQNGEGEGTVDAEDQEEENARSDERERIAESGCYAFLRSVGGVAEVTGTPTISAEGEQYTVIFHDMTEDEYVAAMLLWRDAGNTVYMDSNAQIVFTRVIEGKGYSFNVTTDGNAAPYAMTVRVQGGYAS